MNDLIQGPPVSWATGQVMSVVISPLTLPPGRVLGDFSGFTLTIRSDPLWPRSGADLANAATADPIAQGWPVVLTSVGAVVLGAPTFNFTMVSGAGLSRYAFDVWGQLGAGGEIQLVPPTWLTGGARVEVAS